MRETNRLGVKPPVVRGVWRGYQCKGATESVDHFLVMAKVARNALRTPTPSGRQLPTRHVGRQSPSHAALADGRARGGRSHQVAVNIGLPQP